MNELINQVFQMEGPVKLCVLMLLLQISGRSRGQGFEDTLKDPPEIDRPPQSQIRRNHCIFLLRHRTTFTKLYLEKEWKETEINRLKVH